ncbi:MAG: hypothetical protein KDA89_09325 [Planctomycetaceae bacterium]|nr:hypothetical protein [Planctomycetaceae bacterium]
MKRYLTTTLIAVLCIIVSAGKSSAVLPPEVKKELADLSRELRGVTTLVRKKQIDEAKALIQKIEDRVGELKIAEDERDRAYTGLAVTLERAKELIPVSFSAEIAPILKDKCIRCHDEAMACANLRLDSYANMGKGGRSGPLLIPRNPQRSLILAKVTTPEDQQRMPKNAERLSDEEIKKLALWISGGAEFDGEDMTTIVSEIMAEKKPPVNVVMADGTESVSFRNDVAPWLVGVCMGCHGGNNPRGGYSMETFEKLLQGGPTGNTIVPGDPDASYMVDLVLRQKPLKMPAGNQTFLKRSQAQSLETWIREGAHFDGTDAKSPLRRLVPTTEELEAAAMAAMSESEFKDRRVKQAESTWKQVAPREQATAAVSDNLYVYGNVSQARLGEISGWGEAQVSALKSEFKLPAGEQVWRGRLIVFVTKDRFDYEEFNTVLMNRRTPAGVSGHTLINGNLETAYVAMHDVGDTEQAESLGTQHLLNALLARAFLARRSQTFPDWLQHGFGLLQCGAPADSPFMKALPQRAAAAVATVTDPARLFSDGTLGPNEVGPVGLLLTRFLINNGGLPRLTQLLTELQTGTPINTALERVYGQPPNTLGQAFLKSGGR